MSRQRWGRVPVVLVLASLVVLALLTVFAIELSDTQSRSREDVIARVHQRSTLAAALIDALLQSADQQAGLYSARYGGPVVDPRPLEAARPQHLFLAVLGSDRPALAAPRGVNAEGPAQLSQ